ncbi:hypothetical protein O7599_12400 [Streptomyces sp. WMMC500]|uniref:hypothetical protein n=1 Tax=Streptomyces sp. WMMC500 TaxID=3015154 RepID=UPI00248C57C0|nr:hypothetical protein [Streptomyces sp. WMMC500]WBB63275.1 hypothetical protein O7599_12400 [Streptomyces sp. WMMC500]
MELLGILMAVTVPLALGITKLLDSLAYRNRARGRAEIIRAERGHVSSAQETRAQGRADG